MSANQSTSRAPRVAVAIAAATFAMTAGAVGQEEQSTDQAITAVFKTKEVDFFYRSSTNFYPCHELRNVVTNILRAVGARDDVQVRVSDCENFIMPDESQFDRWDPLRSPNDQYANGGFRRGRAYEQSSHGGRAYEQSSHIRARMMTPVEVTPEVLAEIDKDKSRRALVSRVTGNPAVAMNDPIVFEAKRQPITLSRTSIKLEPEDCQLLDQMTRSVFRELDIRVLRRSFTCDAREENRIAPQMTVEALLPTGALLPLPDPEAERKKQEPAAAPPTESSGVPETTETPSQ